MLFSPKLVVIVQQNDRYATYFQNVMAGKKDSESCQKLVALVKMILPEMLAGGAVRTPATANETV